MSPMLLFIFFIFLSNLHKVPTAKTQPQPDIPVLSQLERIKQQGYFVVLSRYDQMTYYKTADGFSGLEYDLVQHFAQYLNVQAYFIFPNKFSTLLQKIQQGEADFAAAGLTITPQRQKTLHFTPPYQNISEQVIYRMGATRPRTINDLNKGHLEVTQDTSHVETLKTLKKTHPNLQWKINKKLNTNELLRRVNDKKIDYTIADSNQISLLKRVYPKLNTAFTLNKKVPLAWAFQKSTDTSLYDIATKFFQHIKKDKSLAQLIERHYAHTRHIGYIGHSTFNTHIKKRLPKYQRLFEHAAKETDIHWQLLAAIAYQESHWNQKAVSPTGVKGLMMLTKATAKEVGIKNRLVPKDSIQGGARYFKIVLKKIPKRILEPDRTWFALASYNIGFGHLEDARIITQKQGGNPDKWMDVKKKLPLLADEKWYQQTKHGYARGNEPVNYVANIRTYLDLLYWHTQK